MKTQSLCTALTIDTLATEVALTRFLQNEITKIGYRRAVLNLSGDLDSALSCYLTVAALGPENVMALCLPHPTSTPESLICANRIIDALGIYSKTINISGIVKPALALSSSTPPAQRQRDIMARVQMMVLYDYATAWNALVVGASNKTKLLLGQGTLFGDMAAAVNPIGDLYQTQVRQLAQSMEIPNVAEASQTANIAVSSSCEDMDHLLYLLVEKRCSIPEAINAGFSPDLVDEVGSRLHQARARHMRPVVPRLQKCTLPRDWRYLRDRRM